MFSNLIYARLKHIDSNIQWKRIAKFNLKDVIQYAVKSRVSRMCLKTAGQTEPDH